jgi:A/G-specific adenine glycosylase
VLLHSSSAGLLLERRPPTGIWGGLLSLPEVPAEQTPEVWARATLGIEAVETGRLAPLDHGFTHFDLRLDPVVLYAAEQHGTRVLEGDRWLWYNTSRPLPGGVAAPISRLIDQLDSKHGDAAVTGREAGK